MRAMRWTRIVEILGLNAVPAAGWAVGGWTPATALVLFWAENLLVTITLATRIALHRRWTGAQGHDRAHLGITVTTGRGARAERVRFGSFLAEFLSGAVPFVVAHGLFLAVIIGGILQTTIDRAALAQGVLGLVVVEGLALVVDLTGLSTWPFARLRQRAEHLLGRVVLVQLAIIGGMIYFAYRDTPEAFFGAFLALKVVADLGGLIPRTETVATSATPPWWLAAVMRHLPARHGETFEQYWARTHATQRTAAEADERPRRAPRGSGRARSAR
jgi:hypothetical protein